MEPAGLLARWGGRGDADALRMAAGGNATGGGGHAATTLSILTDLQAMMDRSSTVAMVMVFVAAVGVAANLVAAVVFTRAHMRTAPINVMLAGLSAVGIVLLVLAVPVFAMPQIQAGWCRRLSNTYSWLIYEYLYPVAVMPQTCTTYTLVAITLERWLTVCRPMQAANWCTARRAKALFGALLLASISYNFVRFWEFTTGVDGHLQMHLRDFDEHPHYMHIYYTGMYIATHALLPLAIIVTMNTMAVLKMVEMRRMRRKLTRVVRSDHSTTVMMLVVTLSFVVCHTLPFVLNTIEAVDPHFFKRPGASTACAVDLASPFPSNVTCTVRRAGTFALAWSLNDACNLLVVANCACNPLIYYAFGVEYRRTLHRLVAALVPTACKGDGAPLSVPEQQQQQQPAAAMEPAVELQPVAPPTDQQTS